MKNNYLFLIFIFLSMQPGYSQKVLHEEQGESFTLSNILKPSNSYKYTASQSIKLTDSENSSFMYTPFPGQSFQAEINPLMVIEPEEGAYGGAPNNDEGGVVGTIVGNFNVTPNGAAVYSIPINIPVGTAGMSPEISLVYNSQLGDGIMGERWTLSGISSITLAPKTLYFDQLSQAIELPQSQGPFLLDGTRLLAVNTGDDFVEYRTEINDYRKIIAYKKSGSGDISKFKVHTKSGLVYEYGYTENARHILKDAGNDNEAVIGWCVNKIEDKFNNYIEFEYEQDKANGELRIKEIEYTGNSETGLEAYNRIEFLYELERNEAIETVFKGNISEPETKYFIAKMSKYLTGINCYTINDEIFRKYKFDYEQGGVLNRHRIIKVCEKVSEEEFYNPLIFDWELQSKDYKFISRSMTGNFTSVQTNPSIYPGDFNGNGRTDFLNVWYDEDESTYKMAANYDKVVSPGEYTQGSIKSLSATPVSITVLDFSGDGYSDVIVEYSGPEFKYYKTQQSEDGPYLTGPFDIFSDLQYPQGAHLQHKMTPGDYNGDGLQDLLISYQYYWEDQNYPYVIEYYYKLFVLFGHQNLPNEKIETEEVNFYEHGKIRTGDFDGDGKVEIFLIDLSSGEFEILNIENNSFQSVNGSNTMSLSGGFVLGDFNGDQKTDILSPAAAGHNWKIFLSCGNDFLTPINFYHETPLNTIMTSSGDFNTDGRTDIVFLPRFNNGGTSEDLKIWLANTDGRGFTEVDVSFTDGGPQAHENTVVIPGDFEGNGRTDFIAREGNLSSPGYKHYRISEGIENGHRNMVKAITDGLGNKFTINYQCMTNWSTYSQTTNNYPQVSNFIGSLYLVSQVINYNINGSSQFNYSYKGAKTHRLGKGFLGFTAFAQSQSDIGINIKSTQFYDYDNPYFYMYFSGSHVESWSTRLSYVANNMHYNADPNNSKVFFPYINESFTQSWRLDGTFVKNKKTKTQYDEYGNLTYLKTLNGTKAFDYTGIPPDNWGFSYWEEVNNSYRAPDLDSWILGRLETASVTKHSSDPDADDLTRSSAFEYYSNNGMLKSETYLPNNPKSVTKTYYYDDYGNIEKTVRSAADMEDRVIETNYDTDLPLSQRKGRFLTETINGLEHSETKIYDQVKGVPLESTGPNLFTTGFQYNAFGVLEKTISHSGQQSASVLRWLSEYDDNAPDDATFRSIAIQSGKPPAIVYYDSHRKKLREVVDGFDGTKIYTDYSYNFLEQLVSVSKPYFKGTPESDILFTEYTYDELGRNETTTLPGNRITTINYQGLTTVVTNPEGQITKKVVNELGWLIESFDAEQNYVEYKYYSNGLVRSKQINNHPETEIVKQYDDFGNCTSISDPALGEYSFEYNAYGELTKKIKNGNIVENEFVYDVLGRIKQKKEPMDNITYTWDYDSKPYSKGKLVNTQAINGISSFVNTTDYTFDNKGRLQNETETISQNGQTEFFETDYFYDVYGRQKKLVYPSGFSISYKYNPQGFLGRIIRDFDKKIIWELTSANALQQIEHIQYGNGLGTTYEYYDNTGFLSSIETGSGSTLIQDFEYGWDDIGNLDWRSKNTLHGDYLYEDFSYDDLNRLTQIDLSNGMASSTIEMDYDALGRILYKRSMDTQLHVADNYIYDGDGDDNPYNLYKIDNAPAFYRGEDQVIDYNNFGKIYHIAQNGKELDIQYGLGHGRKVQTTTDPASNFIRTKTYIGGIYEEVEQNGETKKIHYISSPGGLFAIYTQSEILNHQFVYIHKDHLGSVQAISDETGALIEEYSYDAWGLRRDPNTWIPFENPQQNMTDRGYTGHEHLDLFALVNMNGRVYDPVIAYFTSPDPIGTTSRTQSFNLYAYCANNPLSNIDPSGYWSISFTWQDVVNTTADVAVAVMALTITITTAGTGTPAFLAGAYGGFVGGSFGTLLHGGSYNDALVAGFKGAVFGALAAGGAEAIGALPVFSNQAADGLRLVQELARAGAHGSFQGGMSMFQGGKFIHGFAAGAMGSVSGAYTQGSSVDLQLIVAAGVGGTAAAIGGGKFVNGAITGAYVALFNHLMHPPQTGGTPRKLADDDQENLLKKVNEATRQERVNNMANNDPWNPEIDDSISVDFNIDGLPEGNSLTGYEIYTTGGVEIKVDNISIQATVIYSPSANPINNVVRHIGDYRTDNTAGRMRFVNSNGYPVVEIQFNNNRDFLKYRHYIYGGE
jgi:RHS repeat-associated protein